MALAARPGPAAELISLSEAARLAGVHPRHGPVMVRARRPAVAAPRRAQRAAPPPRATSSACSTDGTSARRRSGREAAQRRPGRPTAAARPARRSARRRGGGTDALRRLASELSGADALQPVFEEVLDNSDRLFHADRAGLWLWQPEHGPSRSSSSPSREFPAAIERARPRRDPGLQPRRLRGAPPRAGPRLQRRRTTRRSRRRCASCTPRSASSRCASCPPCSAASRSPCSSCTTPTRTTGRRTRPRSPGASATRSRRPSATPGSWPPSRISPRGSGRSRTCRPGCPPSRTCAASARRSSPRRARSSRYDTVRVYRVDHDTGWCEPIAFQGMFMGRADPEPELLRVRIGEGLTGWVAEHGETLLIGDAHADPRSLIVGDDDRPGIDARRADDLRGPRPRHRRRVAPRSGPVRAGRRDDAEHLRRRRRAGAGQRRAAGAAPHAAGRARDTSSSASAGSWPSTSGSCRPSTRRASSR